MQLKKHNSKTPPEERPKWLRRSIALLAAIDTLATGGVVASTAYAEGDTGGGGVVSEVLRKSGSARCREDNFSRLIA